ncbi:MAG: (2Fe-2S)-binding protein [Planctomycetaceae bacterium]|nr:(2Fe-2S)-binding protein [Planctomycetaceae bacterium]
MPWNPLIPGSPVCVCHKIGHDQCRDLVLSGEVTTLDDLKRLTPAGSNCTLCDPYFEAIIAMYRK